jgi:hypothetical protein
MIKTPLKGDKRYANENQTVEPYIRKSARTSRNSRAVESQRDINKSAEKSGRLNDFTTISKEDILPQINEDEEDYNVVTVNNKKKKMRLPQPAPYLNHMRTEPTQEREARNSIDLEEEGLNDSFEGRAASKRVVTESSLLVADLESSKDYFKRPLKLLKKKLQESKRMSRPNNSSQVSSFTNESSAKLSLEKIYGEEQGGQPQPRKIRCNTDNSRDELAINTQLAQAERDRYNNEKAVMLRQR